MSAFADRFCEAADRFGPLCVGIDPHAGRIPDLFGGDTPEGISRWGQAIVGIVKGRAGIVKPQAALFERHGWQGMKALAEVCDAARAAGLVILMDAKRGDIGSTAAGYAAAYLETDSPFACDALTVNPYMGVDTLEPHIKAAEASGKGVIVLARTSNPGSADFQLLEHNQSPLYTHLVRRLAPLSKRLLGRSGWSGLMLVVGATGPEDARAVRELAPDQIFLIPGYGAQGADARDAVASFVDGQGGCVNASRSVLFPQAAVDAGTEEAWQAAIATAVETAQSELKSALSPG